MGPERIRSSTQGAVKYLSISFSCWPSWPVGQRSQDYAESRNLRRCSAIGPRRSQVAQLGIIRNSALSNLCRARHKFETYLGRQMFPTSKLSPFFWFTQQLHLLVKTAYRRERGRSQAMAISPAHRPDRLARLPFRVSFSASPVERGLLVYRAQAHISARFDHPLRRENGLSST